jgi:hypothetical protein
MSAMETTFRPISKRRLTELKGYVAPTTVLLRGILFLCGLAVLGWILAGAHRLLVPPQLRHPAWWLVPLIAAGALIYQIAGRWTGGPAFRAAIREDLRRGLAAAHRIKAVDAIEVDEQEDEGPAYFILTANGHTILFAGQYLEGYKRKGFPWTEFEILEAPHSKVFFGLVPIGDRLKPSTRRSPLAWEEYKTLCMGKRNYALLDLEFEALKEEIV